ncbi:MAG: hypothetical protein A4E53_01368 [Pelotomaculum sp. PtaB.Bin104]|nr:MAG: hypothetical protein A4E53_01368 [Pelotomaculum sp. PtaB.Bin104]
MKPTTIQAGKDPQALKTEQIALLICGILSSLLYVGTDILASMRWETYSWTAQNISELNAVGAPTRPLVISLFSIYTVLVTAFGLGVWAIGSQRRALRITGILLVGYALTGYVTGLFFPMPLREALAEGGPMHPIGTFVSSLFFLGAMWFGAAAHGKRFRLFSIAAILIIIIFGAWVSMDVPRMVAQLPTPWMGLKERVNIYAIMLWVLVLAINLLRAKKGPGSINGNAA